MKITVNSDSSIAMNASLAKRIMGEAAEVLDRFSDRLTRVEIHLTDVDGGKTGKVDKRCLVEVRATRIQPLVASAHGKELPAAVREAMGKILRALNSALGKRGLLRAVAKPLPRARTTARSAKPAATRKAAPKRESKTRKARPRPAPARPSSRARRGSRG